MLQNEPSGTGSAGVPVSHHRAAPPEPIGAPAAFETRFGARGDAYLADHLRGKTIGLVILACAGFTVFTALLSAPRRSVTPLRPVGPVPLAGAFIPSAPRQAPSADPFAVTAPDAEFYRKLNLSQGPQPQYRILLHPLWGMPPSDRVRPDQTVYPLSAVADGCAFYRSQSTGVSFGGGSPVAPTCTFEEANAQAAPSDWAMTRYGGRYYQRTWIRRGDIVSLVQGNALELYPDPSVPDARGLTPLTLAVGSHPTNCYTGSARDTFQPCFQNTQAGAVMEMPEGVKAVLDSHAWEEFPSFPQHQYQPPAWDKEPGFFIADRKQGFDTPGFDAGSEVVPLQAVPDGKPIHCSSFTLNQMLHSYPYLGTIPQVLVDARPDLDRAWTVIKFGDRPYLRGWIADHPVNPLPISRDLAVSSDTRAPEFVNPPVQITLPLRGLVWHETEGGSLPTPDRPGRAGKIVVANIRLDGHAWDKW